MNSAQWKTATEFVGPGVRAVLIQGANGGWGDSSGSSRGLSNETDLQWMLSHRRAAQVVLVGAKTAIRESYRPGSPTPIVALTRTISDAVQAVSHADYIAATSEVLAAANVPRVQQLTIDSTNLSDAIRALNESGLNKVVCEGGPALIDSLVTENLIQEFALTTSSKPAADAANTPAITKFLSSHSIRYAQEIDGFHYQVFGTIEDLQTRLTREEFYVLRQHGTERPFSSDYEKKPAPGYYTCKACGNRLFDADTQFDARCGWPAFWRPTRESGVKLLEDYSLGMRRTEVLCAGCDSHLGHVFYGEGFGFETDARYCINRICLNRQQ